MRERKDGALIGNIIKFDSNGKPFEFEPCTLSKSEYAKIISEINSNYDMYKDIKYASHSTLDIDGNYYVYYFENHGFNDYNIIAKSYY